MKTSLPKILLHLEALILLIISIMLLYNNPPKWLFLIIFLILPDIGILAYLINKKAGSIIYNLTHTYIFPLILLIYYIIVNTPIIIYHASLIWIIHISIDRCLGLGLKYSTNFKDTHLNKV